MKKQKSLAMSSRKKKGIIIGCSIGGVAVIGLAVGLGVGLTQWKDQDSTTRVNIGNVTQIGGDSTKTTTTALQVAMPQDIGTLTATNFKITGDNNLEKGAITAYDGTAYQIAISGITTDSEILTVFIEGVSGYTVEGSAEVEVYRAIDVMIWSEAQKYFNWSGNRMFGFRDADTETEFINDCISANYVGVEFSSQITFIEYEAFKNSNAFKGQSPIKSILMNSVTEINSYAFYNCSSLEDIIAAPSGLTTVEMYAFYGCSRLKSTINLSSLRNSYLSTCVFSDCSSLTDIICPSTGLVNIGASAFMSCNSLESTIVIASPTESPTISRNAFWECATINGLDIKFLGTAIDYSADANIHDSAFFHCASKGTLTAADIDTTDNKTAWANFMSGHGATNFNFNGTNDFDWTYVDYTA